MDVRVLTTQETIFKKKAESVILPGEQGTFEILPFHKHLISRLVKGKIHINGHIIPIMRGIAKTEKDKTTIIIEKTGNTNEP
ncbi:MAG: hypothetical protein PHW62_03380 [Candidatus Ratteibacteria bacterium]|nr:hypothetical protein [Candidatus Ratteibacteria bacterium]